MGPELAVADGALGFWQAIEEIWLKSGPSLTESESRRFVMMRLS
jgi:hypothetical protein